MDESKFISHEELENEFFGVNLLDEAKGSNPVGAITSQLTREMAHMLKYSYIGDQDGDWVNSIVDGCKEAEKKLEEAKNQKTNTRNKVIDNLDYAYKEAVKIAYKDERIRKGILPIKRPDDFTYDNLTNHDFINNFLMRNYSFNSTNKSVRSRLNDEKYIDFSGTSFNEEFMKGRVGK